MYKKSVQLKTNTNSNHSLCYQSVLISPSRARIYSRVIVEEGESDQQPQTVTKRDSESIIIINIKSPSSRRMDGGWNGRRASISFNLIFRGAGTRIKCSRLLLRWGCSCRLDKVSVCLQSFYLLAARLERLRTQQHLAWSGDNERQ